MRLVINRSQEDVKGMLGGHKGVQFTLRYRLELTSEELGLVERYRLADYPLTWQSIQGQQLHDDTIASMLRGSAQTVRDVTTLLRNEEVIKEACDQLPPLFALTETFGGDEIIEYPRA